MKFSIIFSVSFIVSRKDIFMKKNKNNIIPSSELEAMENQEEKLELQ